MTPLKGIIITGLLIAVSSPAGRIARAGEAGLIAHYPFDGRKACYQPLQPVGKGVECVEAGGREGIRFIGQSHLRTEGAPFDKPSLTISLWYYMDRATKDEMKLVMRDQGELLQRVFQLQIYNPKHDYGDSHIRFLGETHPGGGWEIAAVTQSSSILPGNWYHLVVSVQAEDASGPGIVTIWINGRRERVQDEADLFASRRSLTRAMQKSDAENQSAYQLRFSGALQTSPAIPLIIGTTEAERYTFDGVIDDVRFFDYPLNREEVRNLYRNR
jgi:hypothetical protein